MTFQLLSFLFIHQSDKSVIAQNVEVLVFWHYMRSKGSIKLKMILWWGHDVSVSMQVTFSVAWAFLFLWYYVGFVLKIRKGHQPVTLRFLKLRRLKFQRIQHFKSTCWSFIKTLVKNSPGRSLIIPEQWYLSPDLVLIGGEKFRGEIHCLMPQDLVFVWLCAYRWLGGLKISDYWCF